jgi:hypothetical protein
VTAPAAPTRADASVGGVLTCFAIDVSGSNATASDGEPPSDPGPVFVRQQVAEWAARSAGPDSLLTWHFNGPPRPETLLPRRAILVPPRKTRHVCQSAWALVSQYRPVAGTK